MKRLNQELQNQTSHLAHGYDRQDFEKLLYGAEKAALAKSRRH